MRRSEALFHAISNNMEDLLLVCDREIRLVYASKSLYSVLGCTPEEVLGTDVILIVHPDDRLVVRAAIEDAVATGQSRPTVVRYRRKDGTSVHVEATRTLLRNAAGAPDGLIVVARVIEDRLIAEQKLQAAHAETELFLQSIPSILIGLDAEGRITRWNQTAANTFGQEATAVTGLKIRDCGVKWLIPDMKEEVARWLATTTSCRSDDLVYEHEGRTRFLGLCIRRIPPADGTGCGFIITGADITERRTLEEQLRQAQKLEAIGQLAAGIAHEINTPTQYVGDNMRFLKDTWDVAANFVNVCEKVREELECGPLSAESVTRFRQSYDSADFPYLQVEIPRALEQSIEGLGRIAKIVRGMKEFSHPGTEEKHAVDINRAIETTITIARNEWKYCADVITKLDEALPLVPCLVGEFNQVMLNLIINAAHAIGAVVGDNPSQRGSITISTRREGQWAQISVADTGDGIPQEIRSRIFEPFFTTKVVGKGTGQGLAIAHSVVVKHHQGQIWFESTLGQGTTFYIRLPLDIGTGVS